LRNDNLRLTVQAISDFGFRTVSTVVPQRQAFGDRFLANVARHQSQVFDYLPPATGNNTDLTPVQ
jgi:hypothetical protein